MTKFYFLRFETPPTWRARSLYSYPPGTGWPSYTPRHWVPFSLPLTTSRTTVELFNISSLTPRYIARHGPHRKHLFHYCVIARCRGNVSTELFPSNGCCTVACLHSCNLAMALHVTIYFIHRVWAAQRTRKEIKRNAHKIWIGEIWAKILGSHGVEYWGSNLDCVTDYHNSVLSRILTVPPGKFRANALITSRPLPSKSTNSLLINSPIIQRYIIWSTENVVLGCDAM
jgi:hypothetical protein